MDDLAVEDLEDMDGKRERRRDGVAVSGTSLVKLRPRECLLGGEIENDEVGLRIMMVDWRNISGASSSPWSSSMCSGRPSFCTTISSKSSCSIFIGEPSLGFEDKGADESCGIPNRKCVLWLPDDRDLLLSMTTVGTAGDRDPPYLWRIGGGGDKDRRRCEYLDEADGERERYRYMSLALEPSSVVGGTTMCLGDRLLDRRCWEDDPTTIVGIMRRRSPIIIGEGDRERERE